jgi:hypothetical protein
MPLTTIYDGGTRIVGDASALEESLHPSVMAYVNTMRSTTGGNYAMTVNEIDAVNNMVKAMVANGIWSKMKAVYPVIGGTAAAHKYNLVDPRDADAAYRLAFNGGGWTHSSTGMTPNGTSSWANTFLNLSTVLSVSSGHVSYYSRTQLLLSSNVDMGASTGGGSADLSSLIIGRNTNSSLFSWGTQAANTLASISSSSSQGFFIGNQNAATAAGRNIYRNGIVGVAATSYGSPSMPNATIAIGALNNPTTGGAVLFSSRQCAFASIGTGLTATEAKAFSTIVQAYQTKLGRQV